LSGGAKGEPGLSAAGKPAVLCPTWLLRIILVVVALSLVGSCRKEADSSLDLAVDPSDVIDLGVAQSGMPLPKSVVCVTNRGRVPVGILRARVSCPCLKADVGPTTLSPGQYTSFEVRLLHPLSPGFHKKSVFLEVDKPDMAVIQLEVTWEFKTMLLVVPSKLVFENLTDAQVCNRDVEIRWLAENRGFTIEEAYSDSPFVCVRGIERSQRTPEGDSVWKVRISARPGPGQVEKTHLRIRARGSADVDAVEVHLPVAVRRRNVCYAIPSTLTIRHEGVLPSRWHDVEVRRRDGQPAQIGEVELPDFLERKLKSAVSDHGKVQVRIAPSVVAGLYSGTITVRFLGYGGCLSIPLVALYQRSRTPQVLSVPTRDGRRNPQ